MVLPSRDFMEEGHPVFNWVQEGKAMVLRTLGSAKPLPSSLPILSCQQDFETWFYTLKVLLVNIGMEWVPSWAYFGGGEEAPAGAVIVHIPQPVIPPNGVLTVNHHRIRIRFATEGNAAARCASTVQWAQLVFLGTTMLNSLKGRALDLVKLENRTDFFGVLFTVLYHFGTLRKEDTLAITRAFYTENYSKGGPISLEQFLGRKIDLARQLVGSTFPTQESAQRGAVDAVLLALPPEFAPFRTTLTLRGPDLPVWTTLVDLLVDWEKAQKGVPQVRAPGGHQVKGMSVQVSNKQVKKNNRKRKNSNTKNVNFSHQNAIQKIQNNLTQDPVAQSLKDKLRNAMVVSGNFSKGQKGGGSKGKGKGKGKGSAPYSSSSFDLSNVTCFKCQRKGHFASKCPNPAVKGGGKGKGKN